MGTKISCPGQKQSLEQLEWGFGVPDRQIKDSSMHRGDSKGKETFPLHPQPPGTGFSCPSLVITVLLCLKIPLAPFTFSIKLDFSCFSRCY